MITVIDAKGITANVASSTNNKIESVGTTDSNTSSPVRRERTVGNANIFTFDSSKVQVINQSKKGSVKFLVKCEIDIIEMSRNNVNMLRIDFLKSSKNLTSASNKKPILYPQDIIDDILSPTPSASAMQERERFKLVKRVFLDTTAYIDNSIVKQVTNLSRSEILKTLKTKRIIELASPYSKNVASEAAAILATPVSNPYEGEKSRDPSFKQLTYDLLLKDNATPSSFSKPRVSNNSTAKSLSGITTIPHKMNRLQELMRNKMLKSTVKDRMTAAGGSSKNKETDLIPFTSRIPAVKVIVSKLVILTKKELNDLGNNPTIEVSAFGDPEDPSIDDASCTIDIHSKKAGTTSNSFTPTTNAAGNGVSLTEPQTDTSLLDLSGLSIFEKSTAIASIPEAKTPNTEISNGTGNNSPEIILRRCSVIRPFKNNSFTSTGKIDPAIANLNAKSKRFKTFGTTTIVTVALSKTENVQDFGDFVVPSPTRDLATANSFYGSKSVSETDNKFIALSAALVKGGIKVRLGNFQGEYTVGVVRRDTTKKEKDFSYINTDEPTRIVSTSTKALNFLDSNTKENHIYEYRAKIFTRTGREIISTGYTLIKYQKLSDNKVNLSISKARMTINSSGNLDARFTINADITESNISAVTRILKNQNLESYFSSDLEENRDKFKDLIMIGVVRIDLTRGISEDFGIVPLGRFSDSKNRKLSNVSRLKAERQYQYVVSVFVRNPETIIPTLEKTNTDSITKNSYTFKPSKFLHPDTLTNSTLRSKSKINQLDVDESFKAGFTGSQYFVNISTLIAMPTIQGGSVKMNERSKNVLRWKVKGNIEKISYFTIIGSQLGMRSIIGKTNAVSSNRTFSFVDNIIDRYDGEIKYSVIPVYTDLTFGKESNIGKITAKSRT